MCTRCYDYRRLLFLITCWSWFICECFNNWWRILYFSWMWIVSSTIQLSDVLYLWIDNTCFLYYTTFWCIISMDWQYLFPLLYNFLMYYIYGLTIIVSSTIQLSDVLYLWIDNTCFLYYTTFWCIISIVSSTIQLSNVLYLWFDNSFELPAAVIEYNDLNKKLFK